MRFTFLLCGLLFINGCATLSKKECQRGDWSKIGAKDAINGYKAKSQLSQHNSACSKHSIRPNNKLYFDGYTSGLRTFCTRKKGFRYGTDGSEYHGTCPASLKKEFLIGYLSGLNVAIDETENRIDDLRHDRKKTKRKLHSLDDKRGPKEDKGDKKKNKKSGNKLKKLNDRLDSLSSSISSQRDKRRELVGWYDIWSQ